MFSIKTVKKSSLFQARILLGPSGLSVEAKTENSLLLAERFGTLFLIGLLTNLPPGDVPRQVKTPSQQAEVLGV